MTRSDLIAALSSRFPSLMAKDADVAVKEILDAIGSALAQGNRVEIRGFGSFGNSSNAGRSVLLSVTVSSIQTPLIDACIC